MADNLNTPSLPEVKPVSRRHVMAGAVAALSGVTGTAFAGVPVAAQHPDAELLSACAVFQKNLARIEAMFATVVTVEDEKPVIAESQLLLWDVINKIGRMPVQTIEGLWAKVQAMSGLDIVFESRCHIASKCCDEWGPAVLLADIKSLALEGRRNG